MSKKLQTLVLKNREWMRGGGYDSGMLCATTGIKKCCLGIACVQLWGKKVADIRGEGLPSAVKADGDNIPMDLLFTTNEQDIEVNIAAINDDDTISDTVRLKKLRPLFRTMGIKLEFQS